MKVGLENDMKINNETKAAYLKKIAKLQLQLDEANEIIEAQKKVQKILADAEERNTTSKRAKKSSK